MRVVLADYGAGNLRSVVRALERAGAEAAVSVDPHEVAAAPLAVVAGVGHAASAAAGLERHGLADALRDRVRAGRPLLGICVGMQLLFEESEEGGRGLGLLRGPVLRLRAPRVPHMGWNALRANGSPLVAGLDGADVYFAHSYAAVPAEGRVVVAETEHGGPIAAAVHDGVVAGVQFHPERSAAAGARLLENALRWSSAA